MLSAFAATRKEKEAQESALQAQASAQQNQAIAGAATNVGMGVMGGLTARSLGQPQIGVGADGVTSEMVPGLSRLDQFALASSFLPSLGRASATAMGISDRMADRDMRREQIQAYRELENLRTQGDVYQSGVNAYIDRYGEAPSMAKVQQMGSGFAPGAIQPETEFGATDAASGVPQEFGDDGGSGVGMPLPSINPMATSAYRKAEQTVQAIDAMRARPMPAGERQEFEATAGPIYAQAQQVLKKSQPPPPPSNWAELKAAGMAIETPLGGFLYMNEKGGLSYAAGSKNGEAVTGPASWDQMPSDQAAVARDTFLRNRIPNYDQKLKEGWSYAVDNNGNIDQKEPKKEETLFEKTIADLFKTGPEGDTPGADPEKLKSTLNALAVMGELPPGVQKGLDNLEAKYKDGEITLEEVQETTMQIVGLYGTIPVSMQPRIAKYTKEVAPDMPPQLPSVKDLPKSEAMKRERMGLPTQESEARDRKRIAQMQEREQENRERSRVQWERIAAYNAAKANQIKVIDPQGLVQTVAREADFETQIRSLIAAGYRVPGLDGETDGVMPAMTAPLPQGPRF